MNQELTKEQLAKELERLHGEIAELRSVEAMHQQTQAGLQAIELQLAGIIHSAMDAIITVDEDQQVILFNAAAENMFGYSARQVIGQSLEHLLPDRFRERHHSHVQSFGYNNITNRRMGALGMVYGLRSTGEEFPIEAAISKVEVGGKKLFTVILRDITDRKLAEAKIARFAKVLEESINEIYFYEWNTLRFIQVNRGARENLGYTMDELRELTPLHVQTEYSPESFARLIQPLQTKNKEKIEYTTVHRRKDGSLYPVEIHLQISTLEDSKFFIAIVLDITERKRAEEELRNLIRQNELLLESAGEGIYGLDLQGNTTFVNPAGARMLGWNSQELIGRSQHDLIHHTKSDGTPYPREECPIYASFKDGQFHHVEDEVFWRKDGSSFPVEYTCNPIVENGKMMGTVVTFRDMTERIQMESQLRQTERLAELGTLAAGMAHEIGTPMNVILGRAEFLMRKTSEAPTQKGLATIVAQVERITKIMTQLLSFARRRPLERRSLDLASVIHDILDVVRERMERGSIRLETAMSTHVPNVFADRDQMGQVLLNLVFNAIQAMPNGGTLGVGLSSGTHAVTLSVSDTGCGIPPENIPKLFTPFFTTKPVGEGTGLGLTVAHGIIQEHEGSIWVESEPEKGTTFHISLPIYQAGSS